jgi:protein-tyrosine-phosphatase
MKEEYAIDMNGQTIKQVTKEMVQSAEYVIVLTKQDECQNTIPNYIEKHT